MKYEEIEKYKDDKDYIFFAMKPGIPHKTQYVKEIDAEIDEEIVHLIYLFNQMSGVKTNSCCQGYNPGEEEQADRENNCRAYVGFTCSDINTFEHIQNLAEKTFRESGDGVIFEIYYLPHQSPYRSITTKCFVRFHTKKARDLFESYLNSAFEEFSSNNA